jgi:hypothetical protein
MKHRTGAVAVRFCSPRKWLTPNLMACMMLLAVGCKEKSITVPASDTTGPIARLSVDFTNADGKRETLVLTSDDTPISHDISPEEPIAALASGKDEDGGVKNIRIDGGVTIFCIDEETGLSIHPFAQNPDDSSVGEVAATVRLQDWTFNPLIQCPEGVENVSGQIIATAENFHSGTDTTAAFIFEIHR